MPRSSPARRSASSRARADVTPRARTIDSDIAEAAEVTTPARRLTELAQSMSPRVLRALAANPSTPRGILESLLRHFPAEVAGNAAWPLLAMVDPTLGEEVLHSQALRSPDQATLERLAQQPALREAVARNPAASPALLAELATRGSEAVREKVARHPACPVETLAALADDPHLGVQVAVASHPQCPEPVLRRLAGREEPALHHVIALHERVPAEVLERLVESTSDAVRTAVAIHRATPAAALARLAALAEAEGDVWREFTLVEHPSLPPEVLDRMTRNDNVSLHRRVASHRSAQVSTLERLARCDDVWARKNVAANPASPAVVLEVLASDRSPAVRAIVARHPSLPLATLRRLVADRQRAVRHAALRHPSLPASDLETLSRGKGPDGFVVQLALRERSGAGGGRSAR